MSTAAIPLPLACATIGALIGLWAGSCVNPISVAIGTGIGSALGCIGCVFSIGGDNEDTKEVIIVSMPDEITGAVKEGDKPSKPP